LPAQSELPCNGQDLAIIIIIIYKGSAKSYFSSSERREWHRLCSLAICIFVSVEMYLFVCTQGHAIAGTCIQ